MPGPTKSSGSLTKKCDLDPARVNQVFKWILAGATDHDILEAVAQSWPGADAKPLIVIALEKIRGSGQVDRQTVLGWCFEATRDLYRRMVDIGDFPGALRAIKQLADLTKAQ